MAGTTISRRGLLRAGAASLGAASAAPVLAGCGGGGDSGGQMVLSTWNIAADLVTYRKFAAAYHKAHPDASFKVQITNSGNDFNQWFTTQLAGGHAPDIIRITWQTYGRYAQNGGLVDITDYIPKSYGADFNPTFWKAVEVNGRLHGIPQHTDTFGTFYRTDVFDRIGVTPPSSLDKAWTWDQFLDVAKEVKKATGKYAVAYGFEGAPTAYRWLPFLYMHGGSLLAADNKTPTITNDAGVEALAWFQKLYQQGLMSKSNTVKGSTTAAVENLFTTGQAGMMIFGDWIMGDVSKALDQSKWDVTYMVRDKGEASDLGGNILAITKDAADPKKAAEFIQYICDQQNMKYFCENDLFLPVRDSLIGSPLSFKAQSKQMNVFATQAKTVPAAMAKVETGPNFNQVNQLLADQLDLCFTGQQSPSKTASEIASGIKNVLV
jgi:ABC-type glycerol-3-phosphate transport system substrate-binding protein